MNMQEYIERWLEISQDEIESAQTNQKRSYYLGKIAAYEDMLNKLKEDSVKCPKCMSKNIIHYGFVSPARSGEYHCKDCDTYFDVHNNVVVTGAELDAMDTPQQREIDEMHCMDLECD